MSRARVLSAKSQRPECRNRWAMRNVSAAAAEASMPGGSSAAFGQPGEHCLRIVLEMLEDHLHLPPLGKAVQRPAERVVGFGHRPTRRTIDGCQPRHDVEAIRGFADRRTTGGLCESRIRSCAACDKFGANQAGRASIVVVQEGPGRQGGVGPGLAQARSTNRRRPGRSCRGPSPPAPLPEGEGSQI